MAYFAKISEENEVLAVLTLANSSMEDENGVETESIGQAYLQKHNNWPAEKWIQTSYNTKHNKHKQGGTPFRGNLAIPGGTWDPVNNIFWDPSPSSNWTKNVSTASWLPPAGAAPELTDEQKADTENVYMYKWSEENQAWELLISPNEE
tara:strand:+ start:558 stop:1004 length:447 start_codon:yes stop_codon:yes gene_type:complete